MYFKFFIELYRFSINFLTFLFFSYFLICASLNNNFDMKYIKGQHFAKRALEIAAAGGHNVLLIGPPGAGKTLLAKTFNSILPSMSREEILEVTNIYSITGLLSKNLVILSPLNNFISVD